MRSNGFLYTTIISLGFHGLLLFGSSSLIKSDSNLVHFSKNTSQRIQVRRRVQVQTQIQEKPKKSLVKKARKKKALAKKIKKQNNKVLENASRPTKLVNAGQENEKAKYLKRVRDQILAKKRYPKIAKVLKKQGVVDIYFEVSYPKNLSNIQIQKGSGHAILDKSALETIEALNDLPEMPSFLKSEVLKVAIPIKYELL